MGRGSAEPEPKATGDDNSGQAVANPCKGAGVLTRGKRRAGLRGRGGVPTAANRRLRPPPLISDRSPPSAALITCHAHSSAPARRPAPRMRHGDVCLPRYCATGRAMAGVRVRVSGLQLRGPRPAWKPASRRAGRGRGAERLRGAAMRQDDERRTRRTGAGVGEDGTWLTRSRSRLALLRLEIGRLDAGRVRRCSLSPLLSRPVLSPWPPNIDSQSHAPLSAGAHIAARLGPGQRLVQLGQRPLRQLLDKFGLEEGVEGLRVSRVG